MRGDNRRELYCSRRWKITVNRRRTRKTSEEIDEFVSAPASAPVISTMMSTAGNKRLLIDVCERRPLEVRGSKRSPGPSLLQIFRQKFLERQFNCGERGEEKHKILFFLNDIFFFCDCKYSPRPVSTKKQHGPFCKAYPAPSFVRRRLCSAE